MFKKDNLPFLWNVLAIAGAFAATAAVIFFLVQDTTVNADKIIETRTLLREQATAVVRLASLKQSLAGAAIYTQVMGQLLPSKDQLIDFPRKVSDMAHVHNVSAIFNFLGSESAPGDTTPGFIAFTLDLNGAFPDLQSFLKDLESNTPQFLAYVNTFDLGPGGNGYHLLVAGQVFYQ